jgi:methyl-accepting chemotaxis protein
MARVKGREVVLDLMDSVAELRATVAEHAVQLEHLGKVTASLSTRMDEMSTRMDEMSTRMDEMSTRMDEMSTRMDEMSSDLGNLSRGFFEAAKTNATLQQQLGRAAKLIGELADRSQVRFDELEQRVLKLEKKAS